MTVDAPDASLPASYPDLEAAFPVIWVTTRGTQVEIEPAKAQSRVSPTLYPQAKKFAPGRKALRPGGSEGGLERNTVLEFTPSTFAMHHACGSRSPGLASASAIARRIAAATCSCKGTGLSESILPGWYPSHCDHTLRMVHVNWDRRTPVPEAPEMVIGETMIRVRKLGVTVMVVLALMLAACTSSTSPPPTSSTSTAGASTTTITTARSPERQV